MCRLIDDFYILSINVSKKSALVCEVDHLGFLGTILQFDFPGRFFQI